MFFWFKRKVEIIYVVVDRFFTSTEDDLKYLKCLLGLESEEPPLPVSLGGVRRVDSNSFRVEVFGVDYDTLNQYLKDFDGVKVYKEIVRR